MRRFYLAFGGILALALLSILSGCAADAVAEKAIVVSFEATNAFIKAEHDNRDAVRAEMPEVHAFAEQVRREFPPAYREALAALEAYRAVKERWPAVEPGEVNVVETELLARRKVVETIAARARGYLNAIRQRRVPNA